MLKGLVSVPYRGYSFFNTNAEMIEKLAKQRFRPLQGLFIF